MPDFLPYARQSLDETDIAAVCDVLRGDWLTTGPLVEDFERAFAKKVGAQHAVACVNGTAALHLAMLASGIGAGDIVIVPAVTFVATANAARLTGAEVVFADVDPDSGLLTRRTLDVALAECPEAVAVIPVHLNGQCADMEAIADATGRRTLVVDAAHAVGAWYEPSDKAAVGGGLFGEVTAFSFHPAKSITTIEGGMATCADSELAKLMRLLRTHGICRDPQTFLNQELAGGGPEPGYGEMQVLGLNYRLSDVQCALGLSQLRKLDGFINRRKQLVDRYDRLISEFPPGVRPISRDGVGDAAWHLYPVLVDFEQFGIRRPELMRALREMGIGTQVHYLPLHRQPYYRQRYGRRDLPGADAYWRRCLSLPLFPSMADQDVDRVVTVLYDILVNGN